MCYAWKRFDSLDATRVGDIPNNRVENLFATVLTKGMRQLIRRGIDRGYVEVDDDRPAPRGKILLSETIARPLLPAGRVACRHDELTIDVQHNRVLKSALRELLAIESVDGGLKRALREHLRLLHEVRDEPLTSQSIRTVQLSRNTARYAFLIDICELLARSLLPEPGGRRRRFHAFTEDPQLMGRIFQEFVRHFWEREQRDFRVHAPHIRWQASALDTADLVWLPVMFTDVVLESERSRIVVDTKFYARTFQSRHDKRTLRSEHLYQLHTYLSQSDTGQSRGQKGCCSTPRAMLR